MLYAYGRLRRPGGLLGEKIHLPGYFFRLSRASGPSICRTLYNKGIFAGKLLKLLIVMSGCADSLLKSLFLSFMTNLNISGSFRAGMTLGEGI